jgi:aldehyde:ferredoxin oxidoreductase
MELDRSMNTLLKLTEMIAFRKGFGDILADGIVGASRRIGKGVEKYVQNVIKGQSLFSDPRITGLGPLQFEMLVYPGRALGVAAAMGAPSYSPGWPMKELIKQAQRCGMPEEAIERIYSEDSFSVGRMAKHGEDFFHLFDMLGQCHRLYISRFYSMDILAELYSAVTGNETTAADLKKTSERAWNLWKVLNCNAGFDRKDDEPPAVWFQPLRGADAEYTLKDYFLKKELTRADVDGMLDDYYDEHGWDKKTSCPTPEKLEELGLGNLGPNSAKP